MMIVTGAAQPLGSHMISKLNQHNFNYVIAACNEPASTLAIQKDLNMQQQLSESKLPAWLDKHYELTEFIFHLSQYTQVAGNQTYKPETYFDSLSEKLWQSCVDYQIPLIFTFFEHKQKALETWLATQQKAPFFWAALPIPSSSDEACIRSVADKAYTLMRQREKSSIYSV